MERLRPPYHAHIVICAIQSASMMAALTSSVAVVTHRHPRAPLSRRRVVASRRSVVRVSSSFNNGGGADDTNAGPPYRIPHTVFQDGTFPPEKKAASSMKLLFTMVALRVVLAQEEGFGNECHDGRGGGRHRTCAVHLSRVHTRARVYSVGSKNKKRYDSGGVQKQMGFTCVKRLGERCMRTGCSMNKQSHVETALNRTYPARRPIVHRAVRRPHHVPAEGTPEGRQRLAAEADATRQAELSSGGGANHRGEGRVRVARV